MKEQDNHAQQSEIISFLERNSSLKLYEKQMFVAKEEYLNQYKENGYWLIFPYLFNVIAFFNSVSYQVASKEIKESRANAMKKIMRYLIDNRRYIAFNNLHKTNCLKLDEECVTIMLHTDIVEIPI